MIKFKSVSKNFKPNIKALKDISFEIKKGEFVFLIGPSGTGKTTLLRLLLKDIKPSKGEIIVNGEDLSEIKKSKIHLYRRKIGIVFQDYKILKNRTVWENLAIAGQIIHIAKDKLEKETKEVLKLVDLWDKKDFFPAQLSGGELQRLVIARAMINKPAILFADEPTGNLDPKYAWQIVALLRKIHKKGTTVIMASHNTDIVDSLQKRVICLKGGKIASDSKKGKYV